MDQKHISIASRPPSGAPGVAQPLAAPEVLQAETQVRFEDHAAKRQPVFDLLRCLLAPSDDANTASQDQPLPGSQQQRCTERQHHHEAAAAPPPRPFTSSSQAGTANEPAAAAAANAATRQHRSMQEAETTPPPEPPVQTPAAIPQPSPAAVATLHRMLLSSSHANGRGRAGSAADSAAAAAAAPTAATATSDGAPPQWGFPASAAADAAAAVPAAHPPMTPWCAPSGASDAPAAAAESDAAAAEVAAAVAEAEAAAAAAAAEAAASLVDLPLGGGEPAGADPFGTQPQPPQLQPSPFATAGAGAAGFPLPQLLLIPPFSSAADGGGEGGDKPAAAAARGGSGSGSGSGGGRRGSGGRGSSQVRGRSSRGSPSAQHLVKRPSKGETVPTSGYKGVTRHRRTGKWEAHVSCLVCILDGRVLALLHWFICHPDDQASSKKRFVLNQKNHPMNVDPLYQIWDGASPVAGSDGSINRVRGGGKQLYLGSFDSEEVAARWVGWMGRRVRLLDHPSVHQPTNQPTSPCPPQGVRPRRPRVLQGPCRHQREGGGRVAPPRMETPGLCCVYLAHQPASRPRSNPTQPNPTQPDPQFNAADYGAEVAELTAIGERAQVVSLLRARYRQTSAYARSQQPRARKPPLAPAGGANAEADAAAAGGEGGRGQQAEAAEAAAAVRTAFAADGDGGADGNSALAGGGAPTDVGALPKKMKPAKQQGRTPPKRAAAAAAVGVPSAPAAGAGFLFCLPSSSLLATAAAAAAAGWGGASAAAGGMPAATPEATPAASPAPPPRSTASRRPRRATAGQRVTGHGDMYVFGDAPGGDALSFKQLFSAGGGSAKKKQQPGPPPQQQGKADGAADGPFDEDAWAMAAGLMALANAAAEGLGAGAMEGVEGPGAAAAAPHQPLAQPPADRPLLAGVAAAALDRRGASPAGRKRQREEPAMGSGEVEGAAAAGEAKRHAGPVNAGGGGGGNSSSSSAELMAEGGGDGGVAISGGGTAATAAVRLPLLPALPATAAAAAAAAADPAVKSRAVNGVLSLLRPLVAGVATTARVFKALNKRLADPARAAHFLAVTYPAIRKGCEEGDVEGVGAAVRELAGE
jgi:hypothetical protein